MEKKAKNNWIDTFLQEAEDLLAEIDEAALALSEGDTSETIHRIFRAFHTIKGSSGMCGMTAVADFTHHIETLLDQVRSGAIAATPQLADVVLAGRDQVRAIIAAEQGGDPVPAGSSEKLIEMFQAFAGKQAVTAQPEASHSPADIPSSGKSDSGEKVWEIRFRPCSGLFNCGGNPVLLMRDLSALGPCEVVAHTDAVPPLEEIDPSECYLWWSATLHTMADQDAIRDVFMFVEDGSELEIKVHAQAADEVRNAVLAGRAETAEFEARGTAASQKEPAQPPAKTTYRSLRNPAP